MALSKIEKQFGKGASCGWEPTRAARHRASPPAPLLDIALVLAASPGPGIEIYGPSRRASRRWPPHRRRSQMLAASRLRGCEHALDIGYAADWRPDRDSGLTAIGRAGPEITRCRAERRRGCLIVDSVAALVTKAEIEGVHGGSHVGLPTALSRPAQLNTQGIIPSQLCVIFIKPDPDEDRVVRQPRNLPRRHALSSTPRSAFESGKSPLRGRGCGRGPGTR